MGKGDQRTRKGKIVRGTYGVTRLKKKKQTVTADNQKPKTNTKKQSSKS